MKTKLTRIKVGMVTLSLLVLVALSMVAMQASVLVTLGWGTGRGAAFALRGIMQAAVLVTLGFGVSRSGV